MLTSYNALSVYADACNHGKGDVSEHVLGMIRLLFTFLFQLEMWGLVNAIESVVAIYRTISGEGSLIKDQGKICYGLVKQ